MGSSGDGRRLPLARVYLAAVAFVCVAAWVAEHAPSGAEARGGSDLVAYHDGFNLDIHRGSTAPPDVAFDVVYDAGRDELFITSPDDLSIEPQGSCAYDEVLDAVTCPPALGITVEGGGGEETVTLPQKPEAKGHAYLTSEISTSGGQDLIEAGVGNDLVRSGHGQDELFGNSGRDKLIGGDGHDNLLGGFGDDKVVGGKKADSFRGGRGADVLRARDGLADLLINCGDGDDRAEIDRGLDAVRECERH
jgi:hypothetical protein